MGNLSHNLYEVVPRSITLNRSLGFGKENGTWTGSPFKEVRVVPAPVDADTLRIYALKAHGVSADVHKSAVDYLHRMETVIETHWDTTKAHAVFHSSGYDSRIISSIIARLHKKNGDDWLGDTVFVSNKWESTGFRAIMDILGFSDRAFVWREDIPRPDYFAPCFNFAHAWRWLNAPCPIPVNLFWYLIQGAQDKGLLPGDDKAIQGVSGYWANELVDCFLVNGKAWTDRLHWYSNTAMASFPFKVNMMFPFAHKSLLERLPSYGLRIGGKQFRKVVANESIHAGHIPNPGLDDRKHPVAQQLRVRVANECRASWYGKKGVIPSTTEFNDWWGHWSLASLCEYLRGKGYVIV